MADNPKITIDVELDLSSAEKEMGNFGYKGAKEADKGSRRASNPQGGLFSTMNSPRSGNVSRELTSQIRKNTVLMGRTLGQEYTKMGRSPAYKKGVNELSKGTSGLEDSYKGSNKEIKKSLGLLHQYQVELDKIRKKASGVSGVALGERGGLSGGTRDTRLRRVGRGVGKAALGIAGGIGGGILGFILSAYQQGIQNYEATAAARLEAGPGMMQWTGEYGKKGAKFTKPRFFSGARYGFNAAQTAQIQGQAAGLGYGADRESLNAALVMRRSLGEQGLQMGGQFMRLTGKTGKEGTTSMLRELSAAMAVGVKSGLEQSRLPEYMQASVDYAEQQLAITPDAGKDAFKTYSRELAVIMERGGGGLKGRYGAAAMGRMDQAIKGSQGTQQSFMLRAFGFGQGTSFFEALQRQERGVAGKGPGGESNIMAIMKQLRGEYGTGEGGGLSEMGQLAFKNLGLGSTFMAKKFSDIFLKRESGAISAEEAQQRVKKVEDTEKLQKYPSLQVQAWQAMKSLGGVAQKQATMYDALAKFGSENYKIKETMMNISKDMLKEVTPLMEAVKGSLPAITSIMQTVMPILGELMKKAVRGLDLLIQGLGAFGKGMGSQKWSAGDWLTGKPLVAGFGAMGTKWEQLQTGYERQDYESIKGDPKKLARWKTEQAAKGRRETQEVQQLLNRGVAGQTVAAIGTVNPLVGVMQGVVEYGVTKLKNALQASPPKKVEVSGELKPSPNTPPSRRQTARISQKAGAKPTEPE